MHVGLQAFYHYFKRKQKEKYVLWLPVNLISYVDERGIPRMSPSKEVKEWLREYSPLAFHEKVFLKFKVVFPTEGEMIQFKLSFDCPHVEPGEEDSPDMGDLVLALIQLFGVGVVGFNIFVLVTKLIESFA